MEIVIGLEVHIQLKTESKMFCGCSTRFGGEPNSQICPVCLGLPGVLPVINRKAIELGIKTAMALNCKFPTFTKFDRKNYFYPDLPKNYQISQYDLPLARDGYLDIQIDERCKRIAIVRVHLEEDAGKLLHDEFPRASAVDLNRTGIPLLEIVSAPDIRSPEEAHSYLTSLKQLVEYLGVSDCNMEEGSLRCDANLSVRPLGETTLGVKTEIKNMNSFKAVLKALAYEADRQSEIVKRGGLVIRETRLWDEKKEITTPMRTKEEVHDYRYFPEPDLPPIVIDQTWLARIRSSLPEFPSVRRERFVRDYSLSEYDATVLTCDRTIADYFEKCVSLYKSPKSIANWIMGEVLRELKEQAISIDSLKVTPESLVELIKLFDEKKITNVTAKEIFTQLARNGGDAVEIMKQRGLAQISDEKILEDAVEKVLWENPEAVKDYLGGKETALQFLMGKVMKSTQGKANPQLAKQLLKTRLEDLGTRDNT